MRIVFILARLYPYWGFALALALGQTGVFFWRRKSKTQWFFWVSSAVLLLGVALWLLYRGDKYSDRWVHAVTGWIPEDVELPPPPL